MSNTNKQYGPDSLRAKTHEAFEGIVFIATAAVYVGGTIAMLLKDAPLVA